MVADTTGWRAADSAWPSSVPWTTPPGWSPSTWPGSTRRQTATCSCSRRSSPATAPRWHLYSDRHSIFQRTPQETESRDEQLRGMRGSHAVRPGPRRVWASTAHPGPYPTGGGPRASAHADTFQDRLKSPRCTSQLWPRSKRPTGCLSRGLPATLQPAVRRGPEFQARLGLPPICHRASVSKQSYASSTSARSPTTTTIDFNGAALSGSSPIAPECQLRPGPRRGPRATGRQHNGCPPRQVSRLGTGPCDDGGPPGPQRPALLRVCCRPPHLPVHRRTPSRLSPFQDSAQSPLREKLD